ncbi:MAG: hypothetical protein KKB31_07425 [Nanoarchaeota archaeon]|nr:hypothetical protein [Nanoarchaeota archaeon]
MRDFANDLAHIVFAVIVLGLPAFWWWGCIPAAYMIGLLIELKEEDSNILVWESWGHINIRDIIGYTMGGVIMSVILFLIRR